MTETDQQDLEALLLHIKETRRFDFTGYKRTTLERRVHKRLDELGVDSVSAYIDYLEVHPDEFVLFFNTILINVTSFFRDAETWTYLIDEVIPQIVSGKQADEPIRVWSAGCASGEETYSLALAFAKTLGVDQFRERVKIYGTDVDEEALAVARAAVYSEKEVAGLARPELEQFFEDLGGSYQFRGDLRRSVIFGRHDLVTDAPISRLDLLVCRNTLMYFNSETQAQILDRFHFALRRRGFLFLGKAETLLTHSSTFQPVEPKLRIFAPALDGAGERPVMVIHEAARPEPAAGDLRDAAFLEGALSVVIVDAERRIEMINRNARVLFGLAMDDLGVPLQDLQLSYRPVELRSLIDRAFSEGQAIQHRGVAWPDHDDRTRVFDVDVTPLFDAEGETIGAAITFHDVTRYQGLQEQLGRSNRELEIAYEELQSTNEELETTNEELQSTIEELETTNEELQSTNEELETMNEELQSTNDELHVTNEALHDRSQELFRVNAYLGAILTGLHRSVVVLDRECSVQVWNYWSEDYWGLRSDEVIGRNFLNLDIGLPVDDVRVPLRGCLEGVTSEETIVVEARNRRGRDFECRVVCSSLMVDGHVAGAVLLMEDVAAAAAAGDV